MASFGAVRNKHSSAMGFSVNQELQGFAADLGHCQGAFVHVTIPAVGGRVCAQCCVLDPLESPRSLALGAKHGTFPAAARLGWPCCSAPDTSVLPKTLSSSLLPEMQTLRLLFVTVES